MQIKEQKVIGKKSQEECEDGIVANNDIVAVIDGSTSKTPIQICEGVNNGRSCMLAISQYIKGMPPCTSLAGFCNDITSIIHNIYKVHGFDMARLATNPTERMTASAIIYSKHYNQIWMIGDCQCIANGILHENPKPYEDHIACKRAEYVTKLLKDGYTVESLQENDKGRVAIIKDIVEACKEQNITYAVIDGFEIFQDGIKVIDIDESCDEIILASDGYPFLTPTLHESESALRKQLSEDPLCIKTFKATKGLMKGNKSFDDRSYVRFSIND